MKKFLSDYGFTILAAIVIITLITFSSPISSAIQKQTANTVQSLGKVANNDLNKIDDSVSLVDLTNINKSGVIGDFSRKGNLVTINGTQYRVLDVNGTQVKVMSMAESIIKEFDPTNNTYAGSNLDKYLNEDFYNSLPNMVKEAIIECDINQSKHFLHGEVTNGVVFSSWYKALFTDSDVAGTNYYITRTGETNIGKRKVYVLDVDDVIAYLGSYSTPQDLNEMFWNQRMYKHYSGGNGRVWLRSAYSGYTERSFIVIGDTGYISNFYCNFTYEVRPAFVLDLSLLG